VCVSAQRAGTFGCIIFDLRSWMMPKGFDLKCGRAKTVRVWLQGKGGGLTPGQALVLLPAEGE
jgi:hypothetical protein